MKLGVGMLLVLLAGGCVTEGGPPEREDDGKGPVARVHARINRKIDRMPHLNGQRLLAVIQEIIAYKELALEPVKEALPDTDARTRANLIYILGYVGGEQAHAAVIPYLKSEEEVVRFEAAAALVNMGDWSGVPLLLDYMESEDRHKRFKAAQAMLEVTDRDFGYNFDAPPHERQKAMKRWRHWWQDRRNSLLYGN